MSNKIAYGVLALVVIVGVAYALFANDVQAPSGDTGVKPGTTDYTYINASADNIVVDLPQAGDVVGKEFTIMGKARGGWFFEASFPVQVLDKDGNVLAQGPASVYPPMTDWMTNDFVQFRFEAKVPESYIGPATVVLKKDNPSGLSENEASVSYPITVEY